MKVLSIKEPFATLISNGKKRIETRSWKTKYRGELYIHASIAKIDKKTHVSRTLFDYGQIICKCNLVDCIYMTKEFVEDIKKDTQEYICGRYEEGRYAWVLDDIEILSEPIDAKGKLGIWNYEKGD